jgi:glutathionyl-hydroquinone reductase
MGENGWPFANADSFPGANIDPLYGSSHIKDLYLKADPEYGGRQVTNLINPLFTGSRHLRFTVPVLWDRKNQTIVNNESSEIIRMFNSAFNDLLPADKAALDLYPSEFRSEIDSLNDFMYESVNSKRPSVCGQARPERHLGF